MKNKSGTVIMDMKTGEKVKAMPHDIQANYRDLRSKRINDVKLRCRQYGIDWNECDIADGVQKVLDRFFGQAELWVI